MTRVMVDSVVERALAVGRERDMRFRLIRTTETLERDPFMLNTGIFKEKPWVFLPRESDSTEIPEEIAIRPDLLREAGVEIVAEFIGHPWPDLQPEEAETMGQDREQNLNDLVPKIIAGAVAGAAIIFAVAIASFLLLPVIGLALCALAAAGLVAGIDPSLVVVLSTPAQGYVFIEVGRWNDGVDE